METYTGSMQEKRELEDAGHLDQGVPDGDEEASALTADDYAQQIVNDHFTVKYGPAQSR